MTSATRPDRSNPVPLWAQVGADLRRRIDEGEFTEGVPGELALTEEYDVSRHTVREALRGLRSEGVLKSERGRVTTVATERYSQPIGTIYSLYRTLEAQGVVQESTVIDRRVLTDSRIAARLGLTENARLVVLKRIRFADGDPLAIDTSWLPEKYADAVMAADFSRTALYDVLRDQAHLVVDSGRERITPVIPDVAMTKELSLPHGCAAFYIERLGKAASLKVEWRETLLRGDRFQLETEWTTTTNYSLSMVAGEDGD